MSFELFVALRYLKARRKGLFALVTTAIGISGVAVGVAALITTLSVMNGFQSDIQKKVIGAQSHLTLYDRQGLLSWDSQKPSLTRDKEMQRLKEILRQEKEVVAFSPFVLGQAILSYRGRSTGIVLKGLDPIQEFQVNELNQFLLEGTWELGPQGVVLGMELAKNIGVGPGAEVVMISPQEIATPLGLYPKMQKFKVVGLLRTGYYEFDNTFAYTGLDQASSFLDLRGSAAGLQVKLRNLNRAEQVAQKLQKQLGLGYSVKSFSQMNQTLFAALKMEKFVMFIILILIVLVASLNIASNLILLTTEKVRDVGILMALGATPKNISKIFWWEGFLIAGCGIGFGVALGLLLSWIIGKYPIVELPGDIYYLTRVPIAIQPMDILWICSGSLILCLMATFYPALKASRAHPVEAIRYG
ncbi:MAG: ABC transporter permease [Elusimicrobia bacterium]|nr:ABC transporter permease [Elusimicrobiota bacterium]